MEKAKNKKLMTIIILGLLGIAYCLIYLRFASYKMSEECMRTLAMSYKDGFIAAGLLGTIYRGINHYVPLDLFDYEVMYVITKHMLVIYYVLAAVCILIIYNKYEYVIKRSRAIIVLFVVFTGGMFGCLDTIGSFDMYEMIVLLCIMILLLADKAVQLTVPLVIVGILIHPAFLYKCFVLVAAVLIYRWKIKGINKYKLLFIVTFSAAVLTYVISEASLIWRVICERSLLSDPLYVFGSSLIPEWNYSGRNYIALIIFLLAYSPYLLIGRDFFKRLYEMQPERRKTYRIMQLGGLFLLPVFIFKVQYGFNIYFVIMYYVFLLIFLEAEQDKYITEALDDERSKIRQIIKVPEVLVLYPLLFMPFMSMSIMRGFDFLATIVGA